MEKAIIVIAVCQVWQTVVMVVGACKRHAREREAELIKAEIFKAIEKEEDKDD